MKKRRLLLVILLLVMTGCQSAPNPPSNPAGVLPPESIEWVIATNGVSYLQQLHEYPIFRSLCVDLGIRVTLQTLHGNIDDEMNKRIYADALPDLLTFFVEAPAGNKLVAAGRAVDIATFSQMVYDQIPSAVRKYHSTAENRLEYLPGGYAYGEEPYADEGIFVRAPLVKELGLPPVLTRAEFIELIRQGSEWYRQTFGQTHNEQAILMDEKLFGWQVLEHLLGKNFRAGNVVSDQLIRLFSDLGRFHLNKEQMIFVNHQDMLEPSMGSFLFIGRQRLVEMYNRQNPYNEFVRLNVVLSDEGYLGNFTGYGRYKTYITRRSTSSKLVELLSFLCSEEGSRLAVLGREDIDWVMNDGKPMPLAQTVKKMQSRDYRETSGIALLPFFSSLDYIYPPLKEPRSNHDNVPIRLLPLIPARLEQQAMEKHISNQVFLIAQEAFYIGGPEGYQVAKIKYDQLMEQTESRIGLWN